MPRVPQWTGFARKTLWDWLQLLVIPLALGAIAFGLNFFANERDQHREDQRAARERTLAADSRREDALRTYLQQVSNLMLDRGLRTSSEGSQVRAIGRAFTLTVLRRLDPRRKAAVVGFLYEAGLIGPVVTARPLSAREELVTLGDDAPVVLSGADLRNVPLRDNLLEGVNLYGADLRGADFRNALLGGANFEVANLREADFRGAQMDIPLGDTRRWPRGGRITLDGACVSGARFARARLFGVTFEAHGSEVDFSNADLTDADFTYADITQSRFDGALTTDAKFPHAWTRTGLPKMSQDAIEYCTAWRPPPFLRTAPSSGREP